MENIGKKHMQKSSAKNISKPTCIQPPVFYFPSFFQHLTSTQKLATVPNLGMREWGAAMIQTTRLLESKVWKVHHKDNGPFQIQFLCHVLMTAVPQRVLIQSRHSGQFNPSRHFWQVRLPHPACQPSTLVLEQKTPNEILQTAKGACPPLNSYSRGLLVPGWNYMKTWWRASFFPEG